ncbi:hypothetical protein ACWGI8_30180 [Streptomyces sp. NPDC054841]
MTRAVSTPAREAEETSPRMWIRVYTRSTSGQRREIKPRIDVDDTIDLGITANPTLFPACECRIHRKQSQ